MGTYYIDGEFVPSSEAAIPVTDLAVLRGFGVFDFMRTYGGRPFHLDSHINRLMNSARLIGLGCPWSYDEIYEIANQTLAKNDYPESNVRLVITGGDSDDSITPGSKPRLMVMVNPIKTFPESWYQDGVKIITVEINRYIPGAKSIDYIRAIQSLQQAKKFDAVEAVYLDQKGNVLEGTTSNLFAVIDGEIITPEEDILPGITRDVVLDIAASDYPIQLRAISRQELLEADELFLSSSNKEVLPVVMVDNQEIAHGAVGSVTSHVMELFRKYTALYSQGVEDDRSW